MVVVEGVIVQLGADSFKLLELLVAALLVESTRAYLVRVLPTAEAAVHLLGVVVLWQSIDLLGLAIGLHVVLLRDLNVGVIFNPTV